MSHEIINNHFDNNRNDPEDNSSKDLNGNRISSADNVKVFDEFYYAYLFQMVNDWGTGTETDIQVPDDSLASYTSHIIDGMNNIVILIDADKISEDDIDSLAEHWFELMKAKALPKRIANVFLLFTFQSGIPEILKKKIAGSKKRVNFLSKGVLMGYVDLANFQMKIGFEHSGFPSGQSLKNALQSYKDGKAPRNEKELHKTVFALKKRQSKFEEMLSGTKPLGTWAILGICLLMFIWISLSGGSENLMVLLRFGANFNPLSEAGEWWRFIGSMFLHIGILHLIINMFVLLDVGSRIEQYFGNTKYLALYFITGIAGSMASAKFGFHVAAGASGAIFGLCGAAAWIGFRYKNEIPDILRNRLAGNMIFFIIYNLVYGFSRSNIDNSAHIGGLLAGVLFAMLVPPIVNEGHDWSKTAPAKLLFTLLAFLPFAVQGFVAYKAFTYQGISSYPTSNYQSSWSGTTFTYPRLFKIEERDKVILFMGQGMNMVFQDNQLPQEVGISELAPEIKKVDESQGIKITQDEIVDRNGTDWLFMQGTLAVGTTKKLENSMESFITIKGKHVLRFITISDKSIAGDAGDVLQQVVDTVQIRE